MHTFLHTNDQFYECLRDLDLQFSQAIKLKGCPHCSGSLDIANYPRKPRGLGENQTLRFSLCCRRTGCRRRMTPLSLRFFGRKVYISWVFIFSIDYFAELGLEREIARRTISRWKQYWKDRLDEANLFMRWARGSLPPGTPSTETPGPLLFKFNLSSEDSRFIVLKFFFEKKDDQFF